MALETVACPLCGQSSSFIGIEVPDTDLHIRKYGALYAGRTISEWKVCGRCGFVHQNPRPSIDALNEFYTRSQYHTRLNGSSAQEHLSFARWYYGEKVAYTLKHSGLTRGRVFDIGCGQGGVLKLYEELGWKPYGVEPDRRLSDFAINELGLSGVRQGILDSHFALAEKVDLVFSNHAFEHFADLDQVMQGVRNILRPGGYLFIAIPTYFRNMTSISKRWMNSGHYSLFTHNSLNNLLARYGFEEVSHTYSGWIKESDDLWYLARYTEKGGDPRVYFEDPKKVSRYLRVVNPVRTFVLYPVYLSRMARVRMNSAIRLLFSSPALFLQKVRSKIRNWLGLAQGEK